MHDNVNSPSHYQSSNGVECIQAIEGALTPEEFRGYLKGNAIKYIWRAGKKNPANFYEDLEKAGWHVNKIVIDKPAE